MLAVAYATGRVSHARQVKGDDLDKKGYPGPPGWGFSVRLTTSHSKKVLLGNLNWRPRPIQGCRADDDDDDVYTCTHLSLMHSLRCEGTAELTNITSAHQI
jgi:hypothetical protein